MRFLTVEDVLGFHVLQLERFAGGAGIRSLPLLESAVAQPEASFAGAYLHADVFEMAAAYLFHIVQNHPFMDGNKRAGLLAALVFLDLTGHSLATADDHLYELTMNVAAGSADKAAAPALLRLLAGAGTAP